MIPKKQEQAYKDYADGYAACCEKYWDDALGFFGRSAAWKCGRMTGRHKPWQSDVEIIVIRRRRRVGIVLTNQLPNKNAPHKQAAEYFSNRAGLLFCKYGSS